MPRLRPTAISVPAFLLLAIFSPRLSAQTESSSALFSTVIPAGISPEVWGHALAAHKAATIEGKTTSMTLAIIDYTKPATAKRLWVVDLVTRAVLESDYVAHGAGSGELLPTQFSNKDGTHQSSLGTFVTGATFKGVRGLSLRLYGLERGINDNAYTRGLVLHGTPNVSETKALNGTMGRTEGCPGVPARSAKRLIQLIAHGSVVFVWYPDPKFLAKSEFLDHEAVAARLGAVD